jgi:hypothetical protein
MILLTLSDTYSETEVKIEKDYGLVFLSLQLEVITYSLIK